MANDDAANPGIIFRGKLKKEYNIKSEITMETFYQ